MSNSSSFDQTPKNPLRFTPYVSSHRPSLQKTVPAWKKELERAMTDDNEGLEQKKGKDRCGPCYTGKKGKCLVDSRFPYHACVTCEILNRAGKCTFRQDQPERPGMQLNGLVPIAEPTNESPDHSRLVQLESELESLRSEILLLKGSQSSSSPFKFTRTTNSSASTVQNLGPWVGHPSPSIDGSKPVCSTSRSPQVSVTPSFVPSNDMYDPALFEPCSESNNEDSKEDSIPESYKFIIEMLSKLLSPPDLVTPIAGFLQRRFSSTNVPIANLRATVLTSLTDDGSPWLVIDWDEGEDKVLALFQVDVSTGFYNCLMHIGIGAQQPDGRPWSKSYMLWYVQEINSLRLLLVVAQHIFDMLQWPEDESLLQLFCDVTQSVATQEQLNKIAILLFSTLTRIRELENHFDPYWLERISSRVAIPGPDGEDLHVLHASVELN